MQRILVFSGLVLVLVLVLGGCDGSRREQAATSVGDGPADPFNSRMEGGEGIYVEMAGFARGHRAGGKSEFDLRMRNGAQGIWRGRYCLQLLSRDGLVATLAQGDFDLPAGTSHDARLSVTLPGGLGDGAYGLALVVPGRLGMVTTIHTGTGGAGSAGPWPEPSCPKE